MQKSSGNQQQSGEGTLPADHPDREDQHTRRSPRDENPGLATRLGVNHYGGN